ncbi:SixA phosphatase family protein [Minwuia sp.]|uniref:SixA phosphatase family protein n=1 Tax=Minwuia sp. TaxID=2493630 RepID=UPI003A927ABC
MKTVYLMRHAKSDWGNAQISDHERPLNARGRHAAKRMGQFMRDVGIAPDTAFVSTATRTRSTWALLSDEAGLAAQAQFIDKLYLGAPETYRKLWCALAPDVGSVLFLGHSPGIEQLARELCANGADADLTALQQKFPTGALAEIRFEEPWSAIGPGTGRLMRFILPRSFDE